MENQDQIMQQSSDIARFKAIKSKVELSINLRFLPKVQECKLKILSYYHT